MSGVHIQKKGFKNINAMMVGDGTTGIIPDMIAAGFVLRFPSSINDLQSATGNYDYDILGATTTTKNRWCAILECGSTVDSLSSSDPWCVKFEWDINNTATDQTTWTDGNLDVIVGTPLQFDYATGFHTWYTAKYMPVQKRQVVTGDYSKSDHAYDYKEALGILGTTFRSDACLVSQPNILSAALTQEISDITTGFIADTTQSFGDTTVVTNYRELTPELLQEYADINTNYVYAFSVVSTVTPNATKVGGTTGFRVPYKTAWSKTSTNGMENGSYITYQGNTYQATTQISNISYTVPVTPDSISTILSSGITVKASPKQYVIYGGNAYYATSDLNAYKLPALPARYYASNYTNGYWYLNNAIVQGLNSSVWFDAPASSVVITSANASTYGLKYIAELDLTPSTASVFKLTYDASVTAPAVNDLTPSTASIYSLNAVSALNDVYVYTTADNLYKVSYAVDWIGGTSIPSLSTTSPSFTSTEIKDIGKFGYLYRGKYSDLQISAGKGKGYYSVCEAPDESGLDTRLLPGDVSFPAVRRNKNLSSKMFFYREATKLNEAAAYPISYVLTVAPRGFVLSVFEETSDDVGNRNSWVVVQRPVDHSTGDYDGKGASSHTVTSKRPVHCMYSIMSKQPNRPWLQEDMLRAVIDTGYSVKATKDGKGFDFINTGTYSINVPAPKYVQVRRFIVREADVTAPYPTHAYQKNIFGNNMDYAAGGFPFGTPADEHTPDYNAVINPKQQVAISEGNKYVITFPNGLNTARFAYPHEMDLIAYTSADVVSEGTEISITVYGESTPRVYKALHANGPNNTGMRILVLKSGGDIS